MPELVRIERLAIDSDPVRIREARGWLQAITAELGWGAGASHELALALTEACANAHRYAYAGRTDRPIELRLEVRGVTARLSVRDYGTGFDARRYREPDTDEVAEGGYGILLMRRLTDRVCFEEPVVGTRVVLVKTMEPSSNVGASVRGLRNVG